MALNRKQQDLIDKFEKMGIPPPVNSIIVNNDDGNINDFDDTKSKINKIRNGALKEQYKVFIKNPGEEKEIQKQEFKKPVQNKNVVSENKNKFVPPPIKEYRPEGNIMLREAEMFDEEPKSESNKSRYDLIRKQLEEKARREGANQIQENNYYATSENVQPQQQPQSIIPQSVVYVPMNLNDVNLQNLITEMATKIAKKVCVGMIKKVLSESEKNGITIINENEKVKKAEFVEKNIVKIAGKTYKITPII